MRTAQLVVGIVAALALAGGGFAAGMTYQKGQNEVPSAATSQTTGRGGTRITFGGGGGALGGQQPVFGRILAINEGSITVAAVDRGQGGQGQAAASPATTSQIVLVGANTRIVKTSETEVKLGDLKVNDQVTILGTTDQTGMVNANAIVVGATNVFGQLLGSQTGAPGRASGSPAPTKAP